MSKIKKITVSNLKAVAELTMDFNGCTAIITGGNNKGKSSFLKSLPERMQGIKPTAILKQGASEGFAEWELTTGEKFVWSFKQGKEKLSYISEKNISGAVTKEICKLFFPPVFDVDTFLTAAPAKQKKVLQDLTGIDFSGIDLKFKEAYDARTYANKRLVEEKAKVSYIDPKLPLVAIDIEALQIELNGIDLHNLKVQQVNTGVAQKEVQLIEIKKQIMDLQTKLSVLNVDKIKGDAWLVAPQNKLKENAVELKAKIEAIKVKNIEIEENKKALLQQTKFDTAQINAANADQEVKAIEAEKLDVILNASMPDGFGFSDEGITYKGYDFNKETMSSSSIYIAALKLAAIGLGEVKTLHFDASYLDKNSLAEIEVWANENDLQLLIERPDFEGGEIEYQIVNK